MTKTKANQKQTWTPRHIIHLTPAQRKELIEAEKTIEQSRILKKIQSILLKDEGWTHKKTAEHLGVGTSVIGNWITDYLDQKLPVFLSWKYRGTRGRLTQAQMQEIKTHIHEKPFALAQEGVDYIKENFQITYHPHYLPRL
jgi:transposase